MLTENQLQLLKSENELLQLQLEDINQVIREREEELALLRESAREARELQSRLDINLLEFEQMQNRIGSQQQQCAGFEGRMEELENELFRSLKEQLQYAEAMKDYNSVKANLAYSESELEEAGGLYQQLQALETRYAAAESNLEIAQMEISSLKEELLEMRSLNDMLRQKKFQE